MYHQAQLFFFFFFVVVVVEWVLSNFLPDWPQTEILLISASQVVGITIVCDCAWTLDLYSFNSCVEVCLVCSIQHILECTL
jgi:hypothetical protein